MRLMTMMMTVGSAVATYSSQTSNPAVIPHAIPLYVRPVTMSVASMTALCRQRYKTVLTEQLLSASRAVNYQLCTKSLCSYMSGAPRGGATVAKSNFGTLQMYVAINTTKELRDAVKLDYDKATVTSRFSASSF